jgi:SAM-dependent methyltransferase
VRFELADAQTHAFPAQSFDLLFSRFGVMFFADPQAAFASLRRALQPGGRMTFVCWRPLQDNPWMLIPMMAAAQHIELKLPAPDAPGPFAFGDGERVRRILSAAGFTAIQLEDVDDALTIAGTQQLDDAVEFLLQIGPTGGAVREADAAVRSRVAAAVRAAIAPYHSEQGVRMAAAARIVVATNGQAQRAA